MNDTLLGKWISIITNESSVCRDLVSIYPRTEYLIGWIVVVVLKVVHHEVVGNLKAPDVALPGTIRLSVINLINPPVVSRTPNKTIRICKSGKTDS